MAAAIESTSFEEEQLPNERKTMTWKPRKDKPKILGQNKADECLLKNIPNVLDSESEESEFSDTSHNENDVSGSPVDSVHIHPDLEDLGGEVSSMPEAVTFPELQTASVYGVEDWDKELEDSECNPYDAGDLHCGSFQENNLLASYSWREDSFYNPGCHHAACLAFTPPVRMTETGQFDDADE
ncbi:coordinator of PRMT5 and differentiation stimulator isoform X2 [Grus americana]|nr:coordinator of PRMT5 and differentiation stimulator isoform X2 [Grus americana]XP_054702827.1 coordinator of PRMT5 and differentiation stimulator isoform X2 [Grus americana]XP_054702828.1 coordinator of PRMT5 and differentiation stimulator isoform X2 [Grus americana]XP_054702829.1 coordinator of PRMT5 and differentiation stimulator isoform X2 [Grus americana]